MAKKEVYKRENENFLKEISLQSDIKRIDRIFYKEIKKGENSVSPNLNSIVTVHYKGKLINGKEFDNSVKRNYPEAFRVRDVIEGWQIALQGMNVGDKWTVYIPYELGYGSRSIPDIPAFSTLIFDIELLGIM